MKLTLEPTDRILELEGRQVRVWKGKSDRGVPVYALIARVLVHQDDDSSAFDRALLEVPPSLDVQLQLIDSVLEPARPRPSVTSRI